MKVVIVGAGAVGTFLAEDLANGGHDVLLIEKDAECVERLSSTRKYRTIIGDACELATLQSGGATDTDVIVATTGDDEDNLVISLLAKQEFAVPRVIARVNHPKNHWLFNPTWGVDIAVSTPHLLSALVEEAVSVGTLVRLLHFEASDARLVEVRLAEGSPAVGVTIANLGLPRGATVVAVVRDGRVLVPRGDTGLGSGDEILLLMAGESEEAVRCLLVAP
jgi:trk system potassium uptake protein TrkA